MDEVVRPFTTVSDKIRALDRHDVPCAEIARYLGKRYQHVWNVLAGDKVGGSEPSGLAEETHKFESLPGEATKMGQVYRFTVDADGTIRLPEEVLRALEIKPLTIVPAVLENGTFVILGRSESLRRARASIPPWRPGDPLWSEELIAERRREAAAEAEDV